MSEIWRPVIGFEGKYEVSNYGRVRSVDRIVVRSDGRRRFYKGMFLKQLTSDKGYQFVQMSDCHKNVTRMVHRLVAEAFIGPRPAGLEVNHVDEDKSNNCVGNLEYITHKENLAHGTRSERHAIAVGKPVIQYTLSGEFVAEYSSRSAAARETGIGNSDICQAIIGRRQSQAGGYRWTNVTEAE